MKKYIKLITLIPLSVLLASCGGGGGGTSVPPVISYVVDAPVEGLSYTCGALTGTTGSDGSFLHDSGAACTFKVGNVTVGAFNSAPTDGVITPHDLAGVSRGDSLNSSAVAIAQFLQSLDDGSGSGKIKIPSSVVSALSSVPAQKIVDGTSTLTQSTLTNLVSTATGNTKTLVSAATAGAAMNSYIQTKYPDLDVNKGTAALSTSSNSSNSTTKVTVPAPTLSSPPPTSLTAVLSSVGLTATTDIGSIGYYVVLPATAPAPNKWQIVSGTDGSNKSVTLSGSFDITAGTAATKSITGLAFGTDYKVYFVAANPSQTSKMTDVVTSAVSTGAEPKAPILSSTFPKSMTPTSNATSFSVTTDVSGTGYWVVLPSTATAPNAEQVIGGKDSAGTKVSLNGNAAFTGGTSKTFALNGLAYQTAYKLYFVGVNATDTSKSTTVFQSDILSEYINPTLSSVKVIISSSCIKLDGCSSRPYGAALEIASNIDVNFYWVLLPSTESAPSTANILDGKDSAGNSVTLSGNGSLAGDGVDSTGQQTSSMSMISLAQYGKLQGTMDYVVYYVAVNKNDSTKMTSGSQIIYSAATEMKNQIAACRISC